MVKYYHFVFARLTNSIKLAVVGSHFACDVKHSYLLSSLANKTGDSEFYILHIQMESQKKMLRSSVDMKESIHEANLHLQGKVDSLHM